MPTLFIEIQYKTSDGHYLIEHSVFLYEEDYPTYEALEAYKDTDNDEYNIEINDLINKIQNN